MTQNLAALTLGELLSSKDETIRRNAISILKRLQQAKCRHDWDRYGKCILCGMWDNDGQRL